MTKGLVGMILGILSVVFIFIFAPVGLILGIIGLVLSKNAKKENPEDTMAKVGFVLSLIGLIICAIATIVMIAMLALVGSFALGIMGLASFML